MKPKLVLGLVLFACLGVFIGCWFCDFSLRAVVDGCVWFTCAPSRTFKALDLGLPSTLFPENAAVGEIHSFAPDESLGTKESGTQTIWWDDGWGIAVYDVLRFSTLQRAKEAYPREKDLFFDEKTQAAWERPTEITFVSPTANQFFVGCGYWHRIRPDYRCGMVARYEEYVIVFNGVIDRKMTYQDFENIVVFIDTQMANKLQP